MSSHITLNDDQQQIVTQLARAHGQSPEVWLQALLDEAWERECAQYDAAFENDPDWIAGAQEALAEVESGKGRFFPSTEAFLKHLQAGESDGDTASQSDESSASPTDANAR